MKNILIISPHFPPSNLAAVHRSRLFAQHLPQFGWNPVVLTVDEKYYEEKLDPNLVKLLPVWLKIEKARAFKVGKPRMIGDIGLRGFFQLFSKAKEIIKREHIDFLYIPIPSFYVALLGRMLHNATGVSYGIDYIDPWVHTFPGSEKIFSRHWWSSQVAKFLEPIAIKKASLITGVAEGYYKGVRERNPALSRSAVFGAMPYGGEVSDHKAIKELQLKPYLFNKQPGKIKLVYAGAMLPKAYEPLERIFQVLENERANLSDVEFHFIGTGKTPDDPEGYNIKPLALKYKLWNSLIFEYPKRIPYLDVLIHLEAANGIFILGSTEPHYTPSKVYQGVLAEKPVLAVLHKNSTAVKVIENSGAGIVLSFDGEKELNRISENFYSALSQFISGIGNFDYRNVDTKVFDEYSAYNVTKILAGLIEQTQNK